MQRLSRNQQQSEFSVTMIKGIVGGSLRWEGGTTSPGDWEIDVAAVDWIVRTSDVAEGTECDFH